MELPTVPGQLCKSRLAAFIDDFVAYSKSLKRHKFTKPDIGRVVFKGSDEDNAKHRLWECYSQKCRRPLDAANLISIVATCRTLLRRQLAALEQPDPDSRVREFERGVCHKLNFTGHQATLDDFSLDRIDAGAMSPEDFGVPDVLAWNEQAFSFAKDLQATQDRSIHALHEVVDLISRESDDQRRVKLLRVAISISSLNHPGTRWHEEAFNLALTAASKANLLLLTKGYRISDDIQQPATALDTQLNWSRFIPTLNSKTNYLMYAVHGKPMPEELWSEIRHFVEQAILTANRYAEMRPTDELAIQIRSAALSMKARFLAVLGRADAMREADRLHKESLRALDRLSLPYGFAYPIVKHIVRSQFNAAIRCCEEAVAACQQAGNDVSAAAFGAMQFHLTDLRGRGPTGDAGIRELATDSLASITVQYKCSHIFDASAVDELLAAKSRPMAAQRKSGASRGK